MKIYLLAAIQNYIINKGTTDEKKRFLNNYKKKLIVATFGSIYLVDKDSLGSINIINYMYINDVSIRMNYHQIEKDGGVPNHADLDKNFICEKGETLEWGTFKWGTFISIQ